MVDYSKVYLFDDPREEEAMRAEIAGHSEFDAFELLHKGGEIVKEPVWFKYDSGGEAEDVIYTQSILTYLVSEKIVSILEDSKFTGWSTYPINLYDEKLNNLTGYVGLSITGKASTVDKERSIREKLELPDVNNSKLYSQRVGVYFEEDEYDGSDFFTPSGSGMIIVSEGVVKAFEKNEVTNAKFIPCNEVTRFEWSEFGDE
jgi:hypothetical protein